MQFLILALLTLLISCGKPQTVLICGDHVCINKKEAQQYFEENLSLEVKIINNENKKKVDLVELNLKKDENGNKQITLQQKIRTKEKIKILSNDEIKKKKEELKSKIRVKKEQSKKDKILKNKEIIKKKEKAKESSLTVSNASNSVDKTLKHSVDICIIVEKCNIEEISKYLIKLGKQKGYPDITIRE